MRYLLDVPSNRYLGTARPWLMAAIGRRTEHAGQTTITLTGLHAHYAQARAALTRASALLQGWAAQAAEQLNRQTVWHRLCDHLKHVLAGIGPPNTLRLLLRLLHHRQTESGN